jgi:hypothetical protein
MEDMQKKSNCTSDFILYLGSWDVILKFVCIGIVTASELERLKKRFMKLDRYVALRRIIILRLRWPTTFTTVMVRDRSIVKSSCKYRRLLQTPLRRG